MDSAQLDCLILIAEYSHPGNSKEQLLSLVSLQRKISPKPHPAIYSISKQAATGVDLEEWEADLK